MAGSGFFNETLYAINGDFSGKTPASINNGLTLDNQIWMGSTAPNAGGTNINVRTVTAGPGITFDNTMPGVFKISLAGGSAAIEQFTTDLNGPVLPSGGSVAVTGGQVFSNGSVANTLRLALGGTNHALFVGAGSTTAANQLAVGATNTVLQGNTGLDPTFNLNVTLNNTNSAGTQGLFILGTTNFLSNLGTSNAFGGGAGNLTFTVGNATNNSAWGNSCFTAVTTGAQNCAFGNGALNTNTSGQLNVAIGLNALNLNLTGAQLTAVGNRAGAACTGGNNCFYGSTAGSSLTSGTNNVIIGQAAGSAYVGAETNNIVIGNAVAGIIGESNFIRIGNTSHTNLVVPAPSNLFGGSNSGTTNLLEIQNTSNTASSQAQLLASVAGTSAGHAWSQWTVGTTRSFAMGIKNGATPVLTMTTAAGATVDPSTATPAWTLTVGTGFNYDNTGTTSYGIGFNTTPNTNYSVNLSKSSLNDFYGVQISNTNNGNASLSGLSLISDTASCTISVGSSTFAAATAFQNMLVLNATTGSTGIVYNCGASNTHNFYTNAAGGIKQLTIDVNGLTVNSGTLNIGTQQITTTRQTAPGAGTIGERLVGTVASGAPTALTNNTIANLITLSLTAGVWDVSFVAGFVSPSVSPTMTQLRMAVTETSVTFPGALGDADISATSTTAPVTGVADSSMTLPCVRIIKTSTTNVYGIVRALFSAGNISAYGRLSAVRVA